MPLETMAGLGADFSKALKIDNFGIGGIREGGTILNLFNQRAIEGTLQASYAVYVVEHGEWDRLIGEPKILEQNDEFSRLRYIVEVTPIDVLVFNLLDPLEDIPVMDDGRVSKVEFPQEASAEDLGL